MAFNGISTKIFGITWTWTFHKNEDCICTSGILRISLKIVFSLYYGSANFGSTGRVLRRPISQWQLLRGPSTRFPRDLWRTLKEKRYFFLSGIDSCAKKSYVLYTYNTKGLWMSMVYLTHVLTNDKQITMMILVLRTDSPHNTAFEEDGA